MNRIFLFALFFFGSLFSPLLSDVDLEAEGDDFVIATKQVIVPGYPHAFNPALIRYKGKLLMSFRTLLNIKQKFTSTIGLVWLDDELNVASEPYILSFREPGSSDPIRVDDVRLVEIQGEIFLVYADNPHPILSRGGFRVYVAELHISDDAFYLGKPVCYSDFPGNDPEKREKNWVPFDYQGRMLMAYSIEPHLIFEPQAHKGACTTLCSSSSQINWTLGELRGGTPALYEDGVYLSFFHSSIKMPSIHTGGESIYHYFMGAYAFSPEPPFKILQISKKFITAKLFYSGPTYLPYWKPVKVVFPCGLVSDRDYFLVSYGRDDHECWIATILKSKLFQSLINVE